MGTIEITTKPHVLIINGTTILMQADPSATPAWDTLMTTKVVFTPAKKRDESRKAIVDALAALAQTPQDGELFNKLDPAVVGVHTLKLVGDEYVAMVTGFPTQPPKRSTKP